VTAERWWVRKAARWLARFDTTKSQLQAISLSVTAFSTFSLVLQNAGLGNYILYVGSVGAVGWIVYTYLYSEGGVFNQKQRDMSDIGDNYSGPTMLMDARIEARQLAALVHLLDDDTDRSFEELQDEMQNITEAEWATMRDGLDIETIEANGGHQA